MPTRPGPATKVPPSDPQAVYDRYKGFVLRNLRRLGVRSEAVEDAAQDVFLVVYRRWSDFDPHLSSVETWLFGILMRVASDHRRARRRRRAWIDSEITFSGLRARMPSHAGPGEIVAKREAIEILDELLDALDDEKREILIMVDIEQLKVSEAAQALQINLNTAHWRLRAARADFQAATERLQLSEQFRLGISDPSGKDTEK